VNANQVNPSLNYGQLRKVVSSALGVREQDCFIPRSDSKDPVAKSSSTIYINLGML